MLQDSVREFALAELRPVAGEADAGCQAPEPLLHPGDPDEQRQAGGDQRAEREDEHDQRDHDTPIPSVTLLVVMTFSGTSPPSATSRPAARAVAVARVSSSTPVVPLK